MATRVLKFLLVIRLLSLPPSILGNLTWNCGRPLVCRVLWCGSFRFCGAIGHWGNLLCISHDSASKGHGSLPGSSYPPDSLNQVHRHQIQPLWLVISSFLLEYRGCRDLLQSRLHITRKGAQGEEREGASPPPLLFSFVFFFK